MRSGARQWSRAMTGFSASETVGSLAIGEPRGERLRQALLADLRLRLLDRVREPSEARRARVAVEEQVRGPRVAVARLPHRAGIEQPAPLGDRDLAAAL